jgi:hypothetical protein
MLTYLQNPEKIRERPRVETTEDMPTDMNFCQMPQQLGAEEQDGLCEVRRDAPSSTFPR